MIPELLNHLPVAVLLVARDHRITWANHAAEDALGGSLNYLRKHVLGEIFHPSEKLSALVNAALQQQAPLKEYGFPLSGHRVGERVVNLHLVPLGEEVMICFDDASAAHILSHSLHHRQQALAQRNMAAILAHEVKNPLAGIRGAAQLLHKTVPPADRELTQLICHETDRINAVVDEMEFFSGPSELKTEPVNIHEVLHYAKSIVQKSESRPAQFRERFDPSLPPVRGHRNLLKQLFINLLKNAVEAIETSGMITLSTSIQRGVRVKAAHAPLPILITVEDNGPGIPAELQPSIFEPFITTKKRGKGLGLAVVAKIVADHGGVIELESPPQGGTRFHLMLPAATS